MKGAATLRFKRIEQRMIFTAVDLGNASGFEIRSLRQTRGLPRTRGGGRIRCLAAPCDSRSAVERWAVAPSTRSGSRFRRRRRLLSATSKAVVKANRRTQPCRHQWSQAKLGRGRGPRFLGKEQGIPPDGAAPADRSWTRITFPPSQGPLRLGRRSSPMMSRRPRPSAPSLLPDRCASTRTRQSESLPQSTRVRRWPE